MSDKKKILIKASNGLQGGASHHIYNGYALAWGELGYEVIRWESLSDDCNTKEHSLMLTSSDIDVNQFDKWCDFLKKFDRVYMFVSPNSFPKPWGTHLNFVDLVSQNKEAVDKINKLSNIILWSFCDVSRAPEYWSWWKKVNYVPLAFDHLNYSEIHDSKIDFDVCYVGGLANNGFNTKYKIMMEYFEEFKNSGLKCGFFLNKNLSHEDEVKILTNSKVCINIHDDYQRQLQLDTNERTWKTLGINGLLVSDNVGLALPDNVYSTSTPKEMVEFIKEELMPYLYLFREEAEENRWEFLEYQTYVDRVESLLNAST